MKQKAHPREVLCSVILLGLYNIYLYAFTVKWYLWSILLGCHLSSLYSTISLPLYSPAAFLSLLISLSAILSIGINIDPTTPLHGFLFLLLLLLPYPKLFRLRLNPTLPGATYLHRFVLTMLTPLETTLDRPSAHPSHALLTPARLRAKAFRLLAKLALQYALRGANNLLPPVPPGPLRLAQYYALLWWTYLLFSALADAFSLLYELFGVRTYPMFKAPFLATSPRDFWAARWNLPMAHYLKEFVFEKARVRGAGLAALVVFGVSGVGHEGFARLTGAAGFVGWEMGFFLVHAGLCGVESVVPRWIKEGVPRGMCILLCHAVMVISCPLFFVPFNNVYSPYFNIKHCVF